MTKKRILIINPSSNAKLTSVLEDEVLKYQQVPGTELVCRTLAQAPLEIETDADIQAVIPALISEISQCQGFEAYVIASYADPGLHEARTIARKLVLGIQESAVSLSATYGRKFGVIALARASIQRHIAYIRQLGMHNFHAGERALDIGIDEATGDPSTLQKIIDTGRLLIDEDGAEMVILGCAGMAAHRPAAQQALGVPVIDPTQAAVQLATDGIKD